jgi:hypothetical protein
MAEGELLQIEKLEEALREYQRLNRINNDTEAYLFQLGEWALDEISDKPDPTDFGVMTQQV